MTVCSTAFAETTDAAKGDAVAVVAEDDETGIQEALNSLENGYVGMNLESGELSFYENGESKEGAADGTSGSIAGDLEVYKAEQPEEKEEDSADVRTVFGQDDRTTLDANSRAAYPFSSVVLIEAEFQNGMYATGTGCMISADTVLTCGHCVYDPTLGGWPVSVTVVPGYAPDDWPFGTASGSEAYVMDDFLLAASQQVGNDDWYNSIPAHMDLAIIKLDQNIGDQTGWVGIEAVNDSLLQRWIVSAGYPLGNQEIKVDGVIKEEDTENLYYNFDTQPGQSGSPMFLYENDEYKIIGVVNAENAMINFGVRLTDEKINWIKDCMNS